VSDELAEYRHRRMADPRAVLNRALAPEVVSAIAMLIAEAVADELQAALISAPPPKPWLTLREAGEALGCSPEAVYMRARRGRLESRYHGRRLYVSAASISTLGQAEGAPGADTIVRAKKTRPRRGASRPGPATKGASSHGH
jgi:hypothetical protein